MEEPWSLRNSPHGEAIRAIWRAALAAVEPGEAVRRHLQRQGDALSVAGRLYDLAAFERIWIVGGGKAALPMAAALCEILGERVSGGLVVVPHGCAGPACGLGPVEVVEGGHPMPDAAGEAGAGRIADLLARTAARDLVLAVVSGGMSALTTLPAPGLTLQDLQATTDLLLRSGATVVELNTVRKHLSLLKGGDLARRAAPAAVASLILSDVVGDPLEAIGSGPTAPDPTTYADAWAVLARHGLVDDLPAAVRAHLEAGPAGERPETPKPGDGLFVRVQNAIVGSNRQAAEAAVAEAGARGFHALLLSTFVEGEAREVGRVAAALLRELAAHGRPVPRPACLVWGGETTVTVRGRGTGGRNQELALSAAVAMEGLRNVLLVALATDGRDGPTDAAGAVATGATCRRARALGLDPLCYLAENNSYPFFDALDDRIRTGPTGTNVNDLVMMYAW